MIKELDEQGKFAIVYLKRWTLQHLEVSSYQSKMNYAIEVPDM